MSGRGDLAGKVVLVTGAARGVGAATARLLGQAGCELALADIDLDTLKATATGLRATVHEVDISQLDSFERVVSEVLSCHGRIDVVINNAGIMPVSRFDVESAEATQKVLAVNLLGTIYGTRLAYQAMRQHGGGHVINVASIAGRIGAAGIATYSATKFGIIGFTDSARTEAHASGVYFTTVLPGVVATELSAGFKSGRFTKQVSPERVASAIAQAIRRPRREVYVPRRLAGPVLLASLLPAAVIEGLYRRMGADRMALDAADSLQRQAYDERVMPTVDCRPSDRM